MQGLTVLIACGLGWNGAAEDPRALVRDALADQAGRVASGTVRFRAFYNQDQEQPVLMEGTTKWSREREFAIYRYEDPSSLFRRREENRHLGPIAESAPRYYLRTNQQMYEYTPELNILLVRPWLDDDMVHGVEQLYEVHPLRLWQRCCPPLRGPGRSWRRMLEENEGTTADGMSLRFTREGTRVRRLTQNQKGYTGEVIFSLEHGGLPISVVETRSELTEPSRSITYGWRALPDGAFVLTGIEAIRRGWGRGKGHRWDYRLVIDHIDLDPVSDDVFTLEHLKQYLPKNTRVDDRRTDTEYPLFPRVAERTRGMIGAAQALRSRGFLLRQSPP